eukprot:CAMPEP_0202445502 /NCGR_PEP_ID=MMETSP1360-20130828/4317_1 /ASSEMBLY_ACC=CAM_ASM_000848 /TAXON_ID=515479 /ORGANISM="Licmophora paradoxa, Strain CCMP2313" /LENGTH=153 /DNA_ID=CAMNT_0049061799 /DNA_START=48 /DNA_END=509 /DNA_ORIENTATION=+
MKGTTNKQYKITITGTIEEERLCQQTERSTALRAVIQPTPLSSSGPLQRIIPWGHPPNNAAGDEKTDKMIINNNANTSTNSNHNNKNGMSNSCIDHTTQQGPDRSTEVTWLHRGSILNSKMASDNEKEKKHHLVKLQAILKRAIDIADSGCTE